MTRSLTLIPPDLSSLDAALEEMRGRAGDRQLAISDHLNLPAVGEAIRKHGPQSQAKQDGNSPDIVVIWEADGERLGRHLMEFLDRDNLHIIAPETERAGLGKAIFPISPPKAGTHLLLKLLESLGYRPGYSAVDHPQPGRWYYLEYLNAHTRASDFFVDTVRRSVHGNRLHPFGKMPSLFLYRNPLDVVVSESIYYHQEGKTIFSGYLADLSTEERLLRLIDDPWLLGSIRDRMGAYAAWLDFPSVISVSYEELVGAQGGGDDKEQSDAIWSILLKLQVAGDVDAISGSIFDKNSPTFAKGRIGAYRDAFMPAAWDAFNALNQDFMRQYGYATDGLFSDRRHERRRRPLRLDADLEFDTQVVVDADYMGYFIGRQSGLYMAVPIGQSFSRSPERIDGSSLEEVKFRIGLAVTGGSGA